PPAARARAPADLPRRARHRRGRDPRHADRGGAFQHHLPDRARRRRGRPATPPRPARGAPGAAPRPPPPPPLPPSAHDVLREARLLRALRPTAARVPDVLAVCEEEDTIGAPFYVMELVPGEVIVASVPGALDTPEQRGKIGEQLIDALVEIHDVDWRAAG